MEIRRAKKEEAENVDYLLTLLIQDERQYDKSIDPSFVVRDFYEHYIQKDDRCIFVAFENQIVGYLYGYQKEKDETCKESTVVLDALYVLPQYRHQGIGTQLMKAFRTWAFEKQARQIEVNVCSANQQAKNFYQKEAFERFKETYIYKIEKEQ